MDFGIVVYGLPVTCSVIFFVARHRLIHRVVRKSTLIQVAQMLHNSSVLNSGFISLPQLLQRNLVFTPWVLGDAVARILKLETQANTEKRGLTHSPSCFADNSATRCQFIRLLTAIKSMILATWASVGVKSALSCQQCEYVIIGNWQNWTPIAWNVHDIYWWVRLLCLAKNKLMLCDDKSQHHST